MEVTFSTEAIEHLRQRGGAMALDFIGPIG